MAVTTELLDALLSPSQGGGQHSPRAQAEHHLSSLSLSDRVAGLLNLLLSTASSSNSNANAAAAAADQSRAMLCAVLLRRDIATLGGNAHSATGLDHGTALQMMREMVPPLLQLFLAGGINNGNGNGNGGSSKTTRRQVGHCLAELCLSCSVLGGAAAAANASGANNVAGEVMAQVLTGIGPGVSCMSIIYV